MLALGGVVIYAVTIRCCCIIIWSCCAIVSGILHHYYLVHQKEDTSTAWGCTKLTAKTGLSQCHATFSCGAGRNVVACS